MKRFTKNVIDFIKKYSVTQHIINYYNLKVQCNLNYVESAIKSWATLSLLFINEWLILLVVCHSHMITSYGIWFFIVIAGYVCSQDTYVTEQAISQRSAVMDASARQGGHKPGILRDFSEHGKLIEFSENSVQPQGKIKTNKIVLLW